MLTLDAAPHAVVRAAGYFARHLRPWGALERADYVALGVLAFYEARDAWPGTGSFSAYAMTRMRHAMAEAQRREAKQHEGYVPRTAPVVQDHPAEPCALSGHAGSDSASLRRHRRLASRREHNKTYYYRHTGLQVCEGCGVQVQRGHGARRCDACVSPKARALRAKRAAA